MNKTCDICGQKYDTNRPNQKYCCPACKKEAMRRRFLANYKRKKEEIGKKIITKTCPVCGSEFRTDRKIKTYCSDRCYQMMRKQRTEQMKLEDKDWREKQKAKKEAREKERREKAKKKDIMAEYVNALRTGETSLTYGMWQAQRWKDRPRVILPEWAEEAKRGIRTQKFTIPGRLPNMNDLIKGHWTVQQQKKKEAMNSVLAAQRWGKIKPVERYPVLVEINCFEPNARRDQDNVQAGAKKIILDALQRAGILAGDGQKYIADIICPKPQIDRKKPRVEVVLKEGASGVI